MTDLNTQPASALSAEDFATRAGVTPDRVGGSPGNFVVNPISDTNPNASPSTPFIKTEDNSGVVSDTSNYWDNAGKIGSEITSGLAKYGINPPKLDETLLNAGNDLLNTREATLKSDYEASKANTEAANAASEANLQNVNDKALAEAEGRTRIGGFMTAQEAGDIIRLQKQNAIDLEALKSTHQAQLLAAKQAYDSQDYQLAQDKLKLAQDTQDKIDQKNEQYFNDVVQYNNMQTPLSRATDAVQKTILDWVSKYPDAFTGLKPSDLLSMTPDQAYKRVLDSASYKAEQSKAKSYSIESVDGNKVRYGFDDNGNIVSKTVLGAASGGGNRTLTSAQQEALRAAGITDDVSSDITNLILGGTSLEDIRTGLKKINLDPKILDTYDRVVNIANLLNPARTQFKSSTDTTNPFGQ